MRAGLADFGKITCPLARCQASTACAGVHPCAAAMPARSGLSGDDAAHKGSPRFDDDAVLPAELGDFPIAEIGVELDLVDGRHGVGALDERFEVVLLEVRHADRPGAPVGRESRDLPRRQEIPAVLVGQGPVDEEEVDVVGAQELQRGGEGLSRGGGFVIRIVELGGQEDVLARNPDAAIAWHLAKGHVIFPKSASPAASRRTSDRPKYI